MTLQATVTAPIVGDDPSDAFCNNLDGFMMLAELYRPLDDSFIASWNKARGNLPAPLITTLHKQLHDVIQQHLVQDPSIIDMHTNQTWIKNLLWQLNSGPMNGNGDNSLFQYGVNAARDELLTMASCFPNQNMDPVDVSLVGQPLILTQRN